jgi:hypothetical protein
VPKDGALVGKQAAIGPGAPGDEPRAGRHLAAVIQFRITSAVDADSRPHHPRGQVEADQPAVLQAPADGKVVPGRGVADAGCPGGLDRDGAGRL